MEDIFKLHQPRIPVLVFPEIRSLITSAIKTFVGKNLQIDALKAKIVGLKSPDALTFLPKHLQIQFNKRPSRFGFGDSFSGPQFLVSKRDFRFRIENRFP